VSALSRLSFCPRSLAAFWAGRRNRSYFGSPEPSVVPVLEPRPPAPWDVTSGRQSQRDNTLPAPPSRDVAARFPRSFPPWLPVTPSSDPAASAAAKSVPRSHLRRGRAQSSLSRANAHLGSAVRPDPSWAPSLHRPWASSRAFSSPQRNAPALWQGPVSPGPCAASWLPVASLCSWGRCCCRSCPARGGIWALVGMLAGSWLAPESPWGIISKALLCATWLDAASFYPLVILGPWRSGGSATALVRRSPRRDHSGRR